MAPWIAYLKVVLIALTSLCRYKWPKFLCVYFISWIINKIKCFTLYISSYLLFYEFLIHVLFILLVYCFFFFPGCSSCGDLKSPFLTRYWTYASYIGIRDSTTKPPGKSFIHILKVTTWTTPGHLNLPNPLVLWWA